MKILWIVILIIGLNGCKYEIVEKRVDTNRQSYEYGEWQGYARGLKDCCDYPIRSPETHNPKCHKKR